MLKRWLAGFRQRRDGAKERGAPAAGWRWVAIVRSVGLAVALIATTVLILTQVHGHYPVQHWLFWRYAAYWLAMVLFSASCLSAGHRISRLLLPRIGPVAEHLTVSFALGVFAFFAGMFLVGLAGGLGPWFAIGWPLLLLASGARPLSRYLIRWVQKTRRLREQRALTVPLWRIPILLLGALGVVMLYVLILTPSNISFDARWYHLAIAEHYAAHGGIERFAEGWFQGTNPHLASVLYTWGFILPGTKVFDRALLCAHLEFLLFLWTIGGIGALVRRLLHGKRAPLTWVATFLFPGILLYDSNLSVGADHVGAFWAVPIALALMRAWEDPGPRRTIPLAVFISAALLTKYTVVIIAVAPALLAVGRGLFAGVAALVRKARPHAGSAFLGLVAFATTGIVATAPHWLKNLLWHNDPLYPILYKHVQPSPWTVDSAVYYGLGIRDRLGGPKGTILERAWDTLKTVFTFSFGSHDWPVFHGEVPVFGFLFTMSTLLLIALPRAKRVWALTLMTWVGLAVWYSIHPRDRYLQAILPWMVAVVAATLALLWQQHVLHKVLAGGLVGVQLVWGGDVYFFRTHAILHDAPIKAVANLLAMGYEKKYDERLDAFGPIEDIGRELPPGAKVLVHEEKMHLGLAARSVNDQVGFQGGLSYGRIASPGELHDKLASWGVTHVAWAHQGSKELDSVAGDLLFFEFVSFHVGPTKAFGSWRLAPLGARPPDNASSDLVAYLGCGKSYRAGLYQRGAMTIPGSGKHDRADYPPPQRALGAGGLDAEAMVREARYIVLNPKCHASVTRQSLEPFERVARRGKRELWIRKPPAR